MLTARYKSPSLVGGVEKGFSALTFDVVGELVNLAKDIAVTIYQISDLGGCMHDGRVITTAEGASDFGERFVGKLPAKVHSDLPGVSEGFGAASACEVALRDAEVPADLVLDEFDWDLAVGCVGQDILQDLFREVHTHSASVERSIGQYAHKRPL